VNSLNTILAIAIMFICCNGKILIFTEINNSKRGYPTFWTAPFFIVSVLLKRQKKGARKNTVEYPNRTPFPKKRLGGTIVGKWLTFDVICLYSIYLIYND
ncbi:hypothetical protein OXV64_04230, partial [Bacteroides fragilis]|uniref:hypothetical protein n=1 Tax=Bacteroides hominis TaxID=2763023 RepID=UPI0022A650D9|nr:hypothetical protein [Bacteroides fragilis]